MHLSDAQHSLIERVVNAFETGSAEGDYADISIFHDGPNNILQITYGRSQTTEYGHLGELVAAYVNAAGLLSEDLRLYIGRIGHEPLTEDMRFRRLLVDAGREDPVMAEVQDAFFEKTYFSPAMAWADHNGFTLPLSALVIYDSFVHSGSILSVIRNAFAERTPSAGGDEKAWVRGYVFARNAWLASNVRAIVRHTTYRTACLQHEIDRDNWDLSQVPIVANGVSVTPSTA
jgi:chitosanase